MPADGGRFAEYTPTDHRAPLWILTWLSLIYSLLFLAVRLAIKQKFWGLDDALLGIGYVVSLGQWGVIMRALVQGAGKDVDAVHTPSFAQAAELVFASRLLTLLVLGFSKCGVVLFLRMLFTKENRTAWNFCTALLGITGVWTIAAPIIVGAGCSPSASLNPESTARCTGDVSRWIAVTVADCCLEIVGVALPAYLFSTVRMSSARKLTVTAAFVFRLGVVAFFIAYLQSYIDFRRHGRASIGAVYPLIWQQVLIATALMTATIPCLKGFLGRFKTGDLSKLTEYSVDAYGSGHGSRNRSHNASHNQSYAMSNLDRKNTGRGKAKQNDSPEDEFPIRPNNVEHTAMAYADVGHDNTSGSVKSFGSEQKMIIHRRVEWDVVPQ